MVKKGEHLSDETKRAISNGLKKLLEQPENRIIWSKCKIGTKHSEETKEKIRLSKLGKLNPFFGKLPKNTFQKGIIPWSKGLTKNDHPSLMKISENRLGEHNLQYGRTGIKSPVWKGGKTRHGQETSKNSSWRRKVLIRDNYTCQVCGATREGGLNVHHIKEFCNYPELRYEVSNGQTLCRPCHEKTDNYRGKRIKR